MTAHQRLVLLGVLLLLTAALLPRAQSGRGGGAMSRGRGRYGSKGVKMETKAPLPSWSRSVPQHGAKLAGAAAAGALGGAALGYGVGSFRRLRHGYGCRYGYGRDGAVGVHNQSRWGYYSSTSSGGPAVCMQPLLVSLLPFTLGNRIGVF